MFLNSLLSCSQFVGLVLLLDLMVWFVLALCPVSLVSVGAFQRVSLAIAEAAKNSGKTSDAEELKEMVKGTVCSAVQQAHI